MLAICFQVEWEALIEMLLLICNMQDRVDFKTITVLQCLKANDSREVYILRANAALIKSQRNQ